MPEQSSCFFHQELVLQRPENTYRAHLCLCRLPACGGFEETACSLHPQEKEYFDSLKSEKRRRDYLTGRLAAKKALGNLPGGEMPDQILIQSGIFTQPLVVSPLLSNIQVSITHTEGIAGALAFPEAHPMGIDLERINPGRNEALEKQMTDDEKRMAGAMPYNYEVFLMLLWTAKEALSKVLKTGLMTPFSIYEISKYELHQEYLLCFYRNFAQYKTASFAAGACACSITFPKKTEIRLDFPALKKFMA